MLEPLGYGNFYQNYSVPYRNRFTAYGYNPVSPYNYQTPVKIGTLKVSKKQEPSENALSVIKKVGIGTLIATGLVIVGDYIFAKGKHVKSIIEGTKKRISSFGKNNKDLSAQNNKKAKHKVENNSKASHTNKQRSNQDVKSDQIDSAISIIGDGIELVSSIV